MQPLLRLFNPKSIAVIGGGAWGEAVLHQAQKFGYVGTLYAIHPSKPEVAGVKAWTGAHLLPEAPDAAFVGINREATVGAVERLRKKGTGGAVCFASGFAEATAEDASGADAQQRLLRAAGDMPILGPNCYGFINALDRVAIWPDQHGLVPVDSGVAILTQSSNISINLTMQMRGLPIGYMVTCGNQAQLSQAHIAEALLDDPRVTAIGLHIEGFSDLPAWERFAAKAHAAKKPVVALKVGASEQARTATVSHTASLAGQDSGAQAFLDRLGIVRSPDLSSFLETLKLLHMTGPLASRNIASISCSGGEASLAADIGKAKAVRFPPLNDRQKTDLRAALGPKVALANPLDYHTYIWRDEDAMTAAWSAIVDPALALTMIVVDFPRADRCDSADWDCAINAALRVKADTGANIAMVASLPELMPEEVAHRLSAGGVVPMNGLPAALQAMADAQRKAPSAAALLQPGPDRDAVLLSEADGKRALWSYGLAIPGGTLLRDRTDLSNVTDLRFPVVAKVQGLAHKTGAAGIALDLQSVQDIADALPRLAEGAVLIEEMVTDVVAELLIGVVRDPAHGFLLTIGAGGTLAELWDDTASLLIPASDDDIAAALDTLRIAPLLSGYRGKPPIDRKALLDAINAVQAYVTDHADTLAEIEVNPLLCTPTDAIAADALIRKAP
ncbi:acetate--CoA ligase family protein [uncultured Litoreibacter sp.]|uniref:acetate--CoA ligase family protein n=1 Tax=uncultured Litoreibacter sp. TaxID=1392394 RepID=UPI00260FE257|nr:acetate--CoA ligase family protein [uncultured Litoreibacter sp.]